MKLVVFGLYYEKAKQFKDYIVLNDRGRCVFEAVERGDKHNVLVTDFIGRIEVVNKALFIDGKFIIKMPEMDGFSMYA